MLEKETKYYSYNRRELIKKHLNSFVVIKGQRIIAYYDTHEMAYAESIKTMSEGSFLIEHCVPPPEAIFE